MNTTKSCEKLPAATKSYANGTSANFKPFARTALIGLALIISGCQISPGNIGGVLPGSESRIIKVTATGYGATSANDGYTSGQKRLMAMRASKLDAYRALAEQVQGVRVNGNSTVAAMMAQNDSFRVYVDAYLRGAQVITVTPMADGNYETTLELTLNDWFFNRFAQQPGTSYSGNVRGAVGPGYAYGGSLYHPD